MGNVFNADALRQAFEEKEYFLLRDLYMKVHMSLDESDRLFYGAVCNSMFGNVTLSDRYIAQYLAYYDTPENEDRAGDLLKLKGDNLLRNFSYGAAAGVYGQMLRRFAGEADEQSLEEISNGHALCSAISHVPPQTTFITGDVTIPCRKNHFNHLTVRGGTGHFEGDFLFDTGANLSTVSRSWAVRMGMELIESDIGVVTATGLRIRTCLAVAPRFRVGPLRFGNVVFLVLEDEQLDFSDIGYELNGIVGLPVIKQLREVRIGRDSIRVPAVPCPGYLGNLCLEGLMPVVCGRSGGRDMLFTFDTGANRTELSYRYYRRNEEMVKEAGTQVTGKRAGGGGVVEAETYELKDFGLEIGDRHAVLPRISVSTDEYIFNESKDGNIGQDILDLFPETVLSFEYMYLAFG